MYKLLGRGVTTDVQLTRIGKRLFGNKWLGVHASDVKPAVIMSKITSKTGLYYGIINVDGRFDPGSHWLSIIYDKAHDIWYIWDSFARKSKRLIPKFIRTIGFKYIDINQKSDQRNDQDDCGQRSSALLLYVAKHGLSNVHLI